MDLKPGTFIVLEGLDKAGKSTQREALEGYFPDAYYTHQPSGGNSVGQLVYQLTEGVKDLSPVGRQFLHLASHAEHYQRDILPVLSDRAVIMDRCWWSTVAYGWFAGGIRYLCDLADFIAMAKLPTQGKDPSLVFVFTHPYEEDYHNTPELLRGYSWLFERSSAKSFVVPDASQEEVTAFIVDALRKAGLVAG